MGSERLEKYWANEMKGVFAAYQQFEELIPAPSGRGAAHRGEDGRYVESLIKETIKKFLPSGLEILSGFILRAGVSSGFSGTARKKDNDKHSSQLDLIVYDSQNYPVYQRFGDIAVVLPEGVISIISVKKTLRKNDLCHEITMLQNAASLCSFKHYKGPFLALVSIRADFKKDLGCANKVFDALHKCISAQHPICYQEMPGFIGSLGEWTIHKVHKRGSNLAEYQFYLHRTEEDYLGLQYLLKGILDVYYSLERNHGKQPGYVSFPTQRNYNGEAKRIEYDYKCRV